MPFDGTQFSGAGSQRLKLGTTLTARATAVLERVGSYVRSGVAVTRMRARHLPVPNLPQVTVVETLQLARSLIETEQHWITRRYSAAGGRYCAVGALRAVGRIHGRKLMARAHQLLQDVATSRGFSSVEGMNDVSSHHDVLAAFDTAIAVAIAQETVRLN
jgi:hypothetical protein